MAIPRNPTRQADLVEGLLSSLLKKAIGEMPVKLLFLSPDISGSEGFGVESSTDLRPILFEGPACCKRKV